MALEFPNNYIYPVRHFATGQSGGTPGALTALPIENTILVAKNGTLSGARNDWSKPFSTIASALGVALANDVLIIMPGTYTESVSNTVPVQAVFFGAEMVGQWSAAADLVLFDADISNLSAPNACILANANNVNIAAKNSTFTSASNGVWYAPGITGFTYHLDNCKFNTQDDCVQLNGISGSDGVKLYAKNCEMYSLLQPLELGGASFLVDGGVYSNASSASPISPIDFVTTGSAVYRGTIKNAYIVAQSGSSNAINATALFAGESLIVSNCQSNKNFPALAGYTINNVLVASNLAVV